MDKRLFLLFFAIILISSVNAFDFDNVAEFDEEIGDYGEYIIKNSFLGIPLDEVAKIELINNTDVCGIECSATQEFILYEDGKIINEIKFLTLQEDDSWVEQSIRSYQLYYLNGSDWISFNEEDEFSGNDSGITYQIKLEGEKKKSRTVDWIYESKGIWLNSWAVWGNYSVILDEIDNSDYTDHWDNATGESGTSSATLIENNDYLQAYATASGIGSNSATALSKSNGTIPLDLYNSNRNIWVKTRISLSASVVGGMTSTSSFGLRDGDGTSVTLKSYTNSGSDDSVFEIDINAIDDTLDLYNDGVLESNDVDISSLSNIYYLFIKSIASGGGTGDSATATTRIYYVNETINNIILNSPEDDYISPTNEVEFNCSVLVSGGADLKNMSVWTNKTGSWESTEDLTIIGGVADNFGENNSLSDETEHSTSSTSYVLVKTYSGVDARIINGTNQIKRALGGISPTVFSKFKFNYEDLTNAEVERSSIQTAYEFKSYPNPNPSKIVSSIEIYLKRSGGDPVAYFEKNSTINGEYPIQILNGTFTDPFIWSCQACDSDDDCGFATENRTILLDLVSPNISQTGLINLATATFPKNSTWVINASDVNVESCYYNTTDHATSIVTCDSYFNTVWNSGGSKDVTYCANDSVGNENCDQESIIVYEVNISQEDSSDPVGEGITVTFNFSIETTGIPSTTAYLNLNGTNYDATTSIALANGYYFERDVVIPDGWGNSTGNLLDWYWVYNISGVVTNEQTQTSNITVYELDIDDCSVHTDRILNISLRDEEGNSFMYPPIANNTDIQVDLEITARENSSLSWEYSNTWIDDADGIVGVCLPSGILNESEYQFDFTMGFVGDDHVQEFYYLTNGTLDSDKQYDSLTTDQIDLYDLLLADSTSFLFKFYDSDGLEINEGIAHVFRKYIGDGVFREVERGKQDDNGETHLHLVEEDVIYYFKVSLYGEVIFTSSTYNAKCLSTPCLIELEASSEFDEFEDSWDLVDGTYSLSSNAQTRQVTLTYLLDDPQYMNLTVMKYSNNPDTMEAIGSSEAYSTGGSLNVLVPQSAGNITFIAVVYKNSELIDTEWVNFNESGSDYFGLTGIFMALILLVALILMSASEGEGTLIFTIIGLIVISSLKLIDLDYYALVGLICATGILIYKIAKRRGR